MKDESDRAFATAIERAYLSELARLVIDPLEPILTTHQNLMDSAVVKADQTRGGLRLKGLADREGLENRLLDALRRKSRA